MGVFEGEGFGEGGGGSGVKEKGLGVIGEVIGGVSTESREVVERGREYVWIVCKS